MPVAQGSSRVLTTAVRLRLLCVCVPVTLCEGIHAQATHLNVVAEPPGKPVCFTQVEVTGVSPAHFTQVEDTRKRILPGLDPWIVQWLASLRRLLSLVKEKTITFFTAVSYATNHRHLNELHRLSAFQQVTTKVPPSYDGRGSWFAYEEEIDDWCDITELDADKRGPALRNRLEGEAAIHKRLLDRDRLKDPTNGVKYFKSFLRPLFVKGAANVFLYRFQQLKDQHARTIPITPNLVALIFVSLSDLTQDQRQVLASLMAHRNWVLADYNTAELREVYLEIFCTTKTTVDNPLLAPSGHGGRKTFLVIEEGHLDGSEGYWVEDEDDGAEGFLEAIEEGHLDGSEGYWVEDEDDGAEGFLEADEDAFWIYDEEN
eukprot:s3751_g6.t1